MRSSGPSIAVPLGSLNLPVTELFVVFLIPLFKNIGIIAANMETAMGLCTSTGLAVRALRRLPAARDPLGCTISAVAISGERS
jgi:hypothetical protein